jgi:hypothetical protein
VVTSEDLVQRVRAHALGLAEAMSKRASAVDELISVAEGRRDVLEQARRKIDEAAQDQERRPDGGDDDTDREAPGAEAPAFRASALLGRALEQLVEPRP